MRISIAALFVVGLSQSLLAATVPTTANAGIDEELTNGTDLTTVVTGDPSTVSTSKINASPITTSTRTSTIVTSTGTTNSEQKLLETNGKKSTDDPTNDPTTGTTEEDSSTEPASTVQAIKSSSQRKTTPTATTAESITKKSSKSNGKQNKPSEPILYLAEPCDESRCHLPDCRCSDIKLGGNIPTENIPQLVTITFDDAITALNYEIFDELFEDVRNPDGCAASATFYFSHEYTDYTKVHNLWAQGHELALHSVTHGMGTTYWKKATVDVLTREFSQQLDIIEHFAQVDRSDIKGMRMPHFQIPGNNSFVVAQALGLLYDSSWPTRRFTAPALWPYTLDYKSIQDCPIGICPDASFPGLWENPLVNWEDIEGNKCAMLDACINLPEDSTQELLDWMISNFNRHYLGNRAPFGVYLHSSWFQKGENYLEAFKEFMGFMNRHSDVYFVSASRVIEYVRKPQVGKPFRDCPKKREPSCQATLCQLNKPDTKDERWLSVCGPCPEVYPWLDNPLGLSRPTL